ncbi:MAG TPA: HDIG domain-containing protein [Syntrophales bacterium]|nr:HDIG domain-containing protein [Syntrophales bacterium]
MRKYKLEQSKVEGIAMDMAKSISDIIPSREECEKLMVQHSMRPNIVEHSIQVMNVSLAITDNLKNGVSLNRDLVTAGALLHDITKTRSLETNERHDISGGEFLREMGFTSVAEIVEQHIIFKNFNPQGRLEEREIIFYADKRVNHDKIVTIDERVHYLIQRYGDTEEIRSHILRNKNLVLAVERKITDFMKIDINRAIEEIKAG